MTGRMIALALACAFFFNPTGAHAEDKTFYKKVFTCVTKEAVSEHTERVLGGKRESWWRVAMEINARNKSYTCDNTLTEFTVGDVVKKYQIHGRPVEILEIKVTSMWVPLYGVPNARVFITDLNQTRYILRQLFRKAVDI